MGLLRLLCYENTRHTCWAVMLQPPNRDIVYTLYICRGLSEQQSPGGHEAKVAGKQTEGFGASAFNGVRAVPGVNGATVYAAFLGNLCLPM